MDDGRERELKYRPGAGAGDRYLEADTLGGLAAVGPVATVHHEDHYLDTPSGSIARAGYAARLRLADGKASISIKSTERIKAGVADREELEGPAGVLGRPSDWPESPARALLLDLTASEPLEELVTIRQDRRRRTFTGNGSSVEVSLDDVDVIVGDAVARHFTELEVELVRGDASALDEVRSTLEADPALRPERRSKLDRALAAARRAARPPATAALAPIRVGPSPGVDATDLLAEAGRKVLRFHFARMLTRERAVRDREHRDMEDLHAMRVAVRRMRAAWRVFEDGFRRKRTKHLRARLAVVGDGLGAVRDLDVFLDGAATYLEQDRPDDTDALSPLLAAWRAERSTADDRLLAELVSPAHERWLDEYRAFVLTEGAGAVTSAPTAPGRVRDTAPSRLWLLHEQVRAYEDLVASADVATLHQLRIAAKRLRYGLEFLREALGPEAPPMIARVVALQDHVGALHDADVAAGRARAMLADSPELSRAERAAIVAYARSREREVDRLQRSAVQPFSAIVRPAFRRRLGRAVAGL